MKRWLLLIVLLADVYASAARARVVSLDMVAYPGGKGDEAYVQLVFAKPSAWYIHVNSPELAGRLKEVTKLKVVFSVANKNDFRLVTIGDWNAEKVSYGVGSGCGPEKHLIPCMSDDTYQADPEPWAIGVPEHKGPEVSYLKPGSADILRNGDLPAPAREALRKLNAQLPEVAAKLSKERKASLLAFAAAQHIHIGKISGAEVMVQLPLVKKIAVYGPVSGILPNKEYWTIRDLEQKGLIAYLTSDYRIVVIWPPLKAN